MRGHVRKRGNKWVVVVDIGRDATGRRQRRWHSGFDTRRDAEQARITILERLQRSDYVSPSKLTLGAFLTDEWLPAVEASLASSTFESYARNIRFHVVPCIGQVPLQALTAARLNAFYGERLKAGRRDGKGLSPRSVRYLHAIVRHALADAVKWGHAVRNVGDVAEPPSARRAKAPPPTTWAPSELRSFLTHVREDRLSALWLFYASTGVRRGEALALRWSDVDDGKAEIHATSVSVAYDVQGSTPKSERGRRNVALDAGTVAALREHRKRQLEESLAFGPAYSDNQLVFCREDGAPIHPQRVSVLFRAQVKAAGVPMIRLHDLRHTWASLALQAGVNPKVVSERLGHASVGFTLDTYSHAIPGMQQDAAETVAALFAP